MLVVFAIAILSPFPRHQDVSGSAS
jgi:hypothetical protein